MDEGLRLIDVLIVALDYLGWYSYPVLELKIALVNWSVDFLGYTPITWQ